jgi:hypothetical protein
MSGRTLCSITNPAHPDRGALARSRVTAPGSLCRVRTRRAWWGMRAMSAVKFGFFAWEMVQVARDTDETFHDAGYGSSLSAIRDAR